MLPILRLTIFRSDIVSGSCKQAGQRFKLDLRLVIIQDGENAVDGCTGEMARKVTLQRQAEVDDCIKLSSEHFY